MSKGGFELTTIENGDADSPDTGSNPRAVRNTGVSEDGGVTNSAYINSTDSMSPAVNIEMGDEEGDDFSDLEEEENCCSRAVSGVTTTLSEGASRNSTYIWIVVGIVLVGLWEAYFVGAMFYSFKDGWDPNNEPAMRLIVIHAFALFCVVYWATKKYLGTQIWRGCCRPIFHKLSSCTDKYRRTFTWLIGLVLLGTCGLILGLDIGVRAPGNLISLLGIFTYIAIFYVFSYSPSRVKWRPVIGGLILQFIFAYLILRTCVGFQAFQWLGNRVTEFLIHTNAGSNFVFGDLYNVNFAFAVLPVVIFFSSVISMLFYLGVMQIVIQKVSWVMQIFMGTTAGESLNAAGNIFVGPTEAPLMVKPLLKDMTNSELHAVMTGGFATVAGGVLATYISFGIPANHLLSASVMSAPAALAMAKLLYPETQRSRTTAKDVRKMGGSSDRNIIEAASSGASMAIKLVANIAANLIAFLALLQFLNETLKWFGPLVGLGPPEYKSFDFQFICSYLFYPFAWVMGAPQEDCKQLATLIGVKTFTNELIAFSDLGVLTTNRAIVDSWGGNLTFDERNDCYILSNSTYTAVDCISKITYRGEIIAVYALCGFSNLGAIGITLGGLGAMCPERKKDMAKIVLRAMIAGNVACFLTACIAGLLTVPDGIDVSSC